MVRCPFCGCRLEAIPSRIKNKYAGGCNSQDCVVIFRTKSLYNAKDAVEMIEDLVKFSKMDIVRDK